ncbi:MAG: DUF695 domain-containing protein [Myxococcales bacterium]|nr:DUF695 domain-containing protein [Myxococcales bacterium]
MERWGQDFDVYVATLDGKPASFVIDLAAAGHAPVATHPVLVRVRVPMLTPRPDGLRDAGEIEPLAELEDQLVDALETKVDAIYVGRMVHAGDLVLGLYVPEAHRADLDRLSTLTGDPPPGYAPTWSVEDDPGWAFHEFLQPDAYARQAILNRRLVQQFTTSGDQLAVPRPIDHLAYFPSEAAAQAACARLRELGFQCDDIEGGRDDGAGDRECWSLEFHRDDALVGSRPDEFATQILDVILPLDGTYDGWGAEHRAPG